MKPMTFEEWWTSLEKDDFIDIGSLAEKAWSTARQGMIEGGLSKDYYHIPINWDSRPWATYVKVAYCSKDISKTNDRCGDLILTIDRPAPVRGPKKDDLVFVFNQGYLCTGIVHCHNGHLTNVVVNGVIRDYPKHLVKPFNSNYIGNNWDLIPSF